MTAAARLQSRAFDLLRDAALVALAALVLGSVMIGLHTVDRSGVQIIEPQFADLFIGIAVVFFGRLGLRLAGERLYVPALAIGLAGLVAGWLVPLPSGFLHVFAAMAGAIVIVRSALKEYGQVVVDRVGSVLSARPGGVDRRSTLARFTTYAFLLCALALPLMPFSDQRILDLAVLVVTYVMLGWGLNIVVGLAGLLDLGYVAFYAVGAYSYALFAQNYGFGFWACLPLAGFLSASFGVLLGFPVLRLRGDYLAIVTLGFGEMIRLILLNWVDLSNGPAGISGIPSPTFFGHPFTQNPPEGVTSFSELFGVPFSASQRLTYLYYLILALALITSLFTTRIRRLPIGRAWEALREDEIACKALGINPTTTKLTAFAIGAMFAGFAGSFFAAKQNFISPGSFTFIESAIILAIVVLGGMGSQMGVVLAAILLIGAPEWFRDLAQFRMLAFGAAMVLIMIWRPRGLIAHRTPTITLARRGEPVAIGVATGESPARSGAS